MGLNDQGCPTMNQRPVPGSISPIIPAGSDMEKAIAFYEQQLGFTIVYIEGDPVTMAIILPSTNQRDKFLGKDAFGLKAESFEVMNLAVSGDGSGGSLDAA